MTAMPHSSPASPPPSPPMVASTRKRSGWSGAGFWARFHLGRNLRRRGTLIWVIAVPLIVAVMRLAFGVPREAVGQLVLMYLVPLMSLAFGGGVLREEVEDQTLTYGFTRPLDRAALYTARLAAAAGPVLLATVPAVAFAASGPLDAARLIAAAVLGTAAHAALFGLWGLLLRRPSWLGLAYVFLWEQSIEQVPGWLSSLTLRAHIRELASLEHRTLFPGAPSAGTDSWWISALILMAVAGVGVAVAGALVRRRELVMTR